MANFDKSIARAQARLDAATDGTVKKVRCQHRLDLLTAHKTRHTATEAIRNPPPPDP